MLAPDCPELGAILGRSFVCPAMCDDGATASQGRSSWLSTDEILGECEPKSVGRAGKARISLNKTFGSCLDLGDTRTLLCYPDAVDIRNPKPALSTCIQTYVSTSALLREEQDYYTRSARKVIPDLEILAQPFNVRNDRNYIAYPHSNTTGHNSSRQ